MFQSISEVLKSKRKSKGFSVKDVLQRLAECGISISDKTLYGWESGYRQPDADTFLVLCQIYGIESISEITKGKSSSFALSTQDQKLLSIFHQLNSEGRTRLLETADDMLRSGKYLPVSVKKMENRAV